MPVHVEEMTTEVAAFEGEIPLSPEQLEKIVERVIELQKQREQDMKAHRDATAIRSRAAPEAAGGIGK